MYLIDQQTANRIAQTVQMKYLLTQKMFLAKTEEEVEAIEEDLERQVLAATGSEQVARAILVYLPILMEQEAITMFQNKTGENLRAIAPEILTPREAAEIAQMDIRLTDEEKATTIKILTRILSNLSNQTVLPSSQEES